MHDSGARTNSSHHASPLRADIQVLRGLAVLWVLVHHAKLLPWSDGGFLGVDVFFVISGYLITGNIARSLQSGTFSFREFYLRRIRRLLPAAYVTFAVTIALSAWILPTTSLRAFASEMPATVFFSGNMMLLRHVDYFAASAHLNPLLHVWSLAIEEQFYFVLPALLYFTRPRTTLVLLIVGTLSLAACLLLVRDYPSATFYLLPTRAWELAIGGLTAVALTTKSIPRAWNTSLATASSLLVVLLPLHPLSPTHPGLDALLVCGATATLLRVAHTAFSSRVFSPLRWTGDISYSLYLVHWPMFALANNFYLEHTPFAVRVALFVLSFGVAYASYRFVETPWRSGTASGRRVVSAAAVGACVLAVASVAPWFLRDKTIFEQLRPNVGLSLACDGPPPSGLAACQSGARPRIAVWGDSHAMHWVPAIEQTGLPFMQLTMSRCAPNVHATTFLRGSEFGEAWAERCRSFNAEALRRIVDSEVETVLMAWSLETTLVKNRSLLDEASRVLPVESSHQQWVETMVATIKELQRSGRRVVVAESPPSPGFDAGACYEQAFGVPPMSRENCDFRRSQTSSTTIHSIVERSGVSTLDVSSTVCDVRQARCRTIEKGLPIYRDAEHLSVSGARRIADVTNLRNLLLGGL